MINRKLQISVGLIERRIYLIRGRKVMLDSDLAELYNVPTHRLNQAVKRNIQRFPQDFMFRLNSKEDKSLRSQIVMSKIGRGGRRYFPFVFTEQGITMLSSVLKSEQAISVNIAIIRAFVKLREILLTNDKLSRKVDTMEKKYDGQFKVVFTIIEKLVASPEPKKGRIGFDPSRAS